MKIGDKILCIKDREYCNIKGNIYTILNMIGEEVMVSVENNLYHLQAYYTINSDIDKWQLYEHFNVIKIVRKEKLEKIYGTNL